MKKISQMIVKGRFVFLGIFGVLFILSIIGMLFVDVNYDSTKYLSKDSETSKGLNIMFEEFGENGTSTVMIKNVSFGSALQVKKEIIEIDGVKEIIWIDNILENSCPNEITLEDYWKIIEIVSRDEFNVAMNGITKLLLSSTSATAEEKEQAIKAVQKVIEDIKSVRPENMEERAYLEMLFTLVLEFSSLEQYEGELQNFYQDIIKAKPNDKNGIPLNDADYIVLLMKLALFENVNAADFNMNTTDLIAFQISIGTIMLKYKNLIETLATMITSKNMISTEALSEVNRFYNQNCALFQVSFVESDYSERTIQAIKKIRELDEPTYLSGNASNVANSVSVVNKETFKGMAIAFVIIIVILIFTSASYMEPVILLIVIGVSVLINMGTNIFMGSISYMTKGVSALLQVALTIDYAIFLIHRYREEKTKAEDVKVAMSNALAESFGPILASSLTTIAGFVAIMFMKYKIGLDMGVVFAKGILISLIAVFLLMPALLIIFNQWIEKLEHRTFKFEFKPFAKFLKKARLIIPIIFLLMIIPAFKIQQNNSYVYGNEASLGSKGSSLLVEKEEIETIFGSQNQAVILIPKEVAKKQELKISNDLLNHPVLKDKISVQSASLIQNSGMNDFLPNSFMKNFESENYNRIVLYLNAPEEGEETTKIISEIRGVLKQNDVKTYYLLGNSPSTLEIQTQVNSDYWKITLISIVLVAIIILFTFKSVLIPVILVFVIQSSIWMNMAIPALTHSPLIFIGYMIVSTVQLGATIDYAILFTNRYLEGRKSMEKFDAMIYAVKNSFISILTSGGILCISGFVISEASTLPAISIFGTLIGRGTICSVLLVLILLPEILVLLDRLVLTSMFRRKQKLVLDDMVYIGSEYGEEYRVPESATLPNEVIYIKDNYYTYQGIDNIRHTVRVLAQREDGLFGFIRIIGKDEFGERNHLESCGGGIEPGETEETAVHREVMEELGYKCEIISFLGTIIHDFNVIRRTTYANYYYIKVDTTVHYNTNLTKRESELFRGVEWYTLDDAIKKMKLEECQIGKLVRKREIAAIQLMKTYSKANWK